MNDEHVHHVAEPLHDAGHNLLNDRWVHFPAFDLHYFFEVTAVAVLHENVVASICFDSLP